MATYDFPQALADISDVILTELQISDNPKVTVTFNEVEDSDFKVHRRDSNSSSSLLSEPPSPAFSAKFDYMAKSSTHSFQSLSQPKRPWATSNSISPSTIKWTRSVESFPMVVEAQRSLPIALSTIPISPPQSSAPPEQPIHKLSSDTIRLIFNYCLPEPGPSLYIEPDVTAAPITLAQVCKSWRTTARSTPSLWSSILICGSDGQLSKRLSVLESWLALSGTEPLSIGVCVLQFRLMPYPHLENILDALLPYSARWKNLHLRIPDMYLERLFSRPNETLPILHSLRLDPISPPFRVGGVWSFRIIPTPAALRHVSINGATVQLSPHQLNLNWSYLTKITSMAYMTIDDCSELFRMCTSLEVCSLLCVHTTFQGLYPDEPQPMITVSKLSSLSLHCVGPSFDGIASLFDALRLPSLKSLELSGPDLPLWPQPHFRRLLIQSTPPLSSLKFINMPIADEHLTEIVKLLPELKKLDAYMHNQDVRSARVKELLWRRKN